jgi:tetratricopeptide (TPR) repeat protein
MLASVALTALLLTRLDSPVTDRAEALAKEALKQGNDARGAAPLMRLHALLDEVDDLNLLAEPYTALIYRRNTEPHVRALAKLFMADVERARGRTVKSTELINDLGFIQDFHVVGSFDNEGKGGCDTDFGPESALDLKAAYPSKAREVGWRKPHAKTVDGFVDLSLALKPNTEAVGYALTWLQSDAETKAVLSFGASGGLKVWVNGVKAISSDRYNLARMDQHQVQVNLRKGLNRVLVKVCQLSGPFGFYARVEKVEGQKGTITVALPETVPALEKGVAPQPVLQPTLTELMEKKLKATPNDAGLRGDYATILSWTRAFPDSEHAPQTEAERAALNAPTDVELAVLAGSLHDDDVNDRRRFLELALQLDPKHAFARLALGQHELSREHPELALQHAETLLAAFPNFGPAWVLKIRALEALSQKTAAWRTTEEAFSKLHVLPSISREAVAASRRADRLTEAVERARAVIALRFDDTNTRRGLASLLADLGKVDDAVDQYRKVLSIDPFDQGSMLRLAELLSANGRLDEARATFEQARRAAPDEPEVYEREGKALLHADLKNDAMAALQKSLALRPQNPALKEMLRTLRGDDTANTTPEAFALAGLIDESKKTAASTDDALILAEVTHVRVQPSGLSSRFSQAVVKVLTQRGVEGWRSLPITWSPDRQEVRVLRARITKPDGSVVDSFGDEERNINEPWSGMYYDARARVLSFPALAPGDVLELQWRIEDTSIDNLLSDYWGDVDSIQSTSRKLHYRYVVEMPKARPLAWNAKQLPAWVKTSSKEEGEHTVYRFEANDVAKVIPEPSMPGWSEVATPLHLSTYQNWEQVGRYYWGLVREQLVPNDELKRAVEGALKGVDKNDTQKVVAALYGFVVTHTRYVALEFGIHGYKPYRVDRILARKFGDCKDKASLIHAMLKVAGVDSKLVLLRMRHLGTLAPEPASLAAFNHAIVYVPKLDLFLDGTAEFHGSHELAPSDRVANVLIVEPDGVSRFITTPEANPDDNLTSMVLDVTLKPDGSASAKGSQVTRGQAAPEQRRTYQTAATRNAMFEQTWAQSYPGLTVSDLTVSDTTDLESPLTLKFGITMPRFAEVGPRFLRFFPFGAGRSFTQAIAPLSERKQDLLMSGVFSNELTMNYTLPPNFTVSELPPEVVEDSPFGTLRITVDKKDGKLRTYCRISLTRARITAKEYPEFRAWLMKVDQAFGRKLMVQQGGQTASR